MAQRFAPDIGIRPDTPAQRTRRAQQTSRRRRSLRWWLALSSLAIAVAAPLPYLLSSLDSLATDGQDIAANYADRAGWLQLAFYAHITFGALR